MYDESHSPRLSEQISVAPTNNTSGNHETGTSSIVGESSSDCSLNDLTCSKYKFYYNRLYKCLGYLERENRRLLDAIRNRVRVNEECKPLEELLDEFAFKVANKKDAYEKALVEQAATQGQHAFMAKQWKMRYKNLLEVANSLKTHCTASESKTKEGTTSDEQTKVEEYFGDVCSVPWDCKLSFETAMKNAVLDIELDHEGLENGRRASMYEFNDLTIPISSVFIQDLVANHNLVTGEIKRQNEMKCRLFHVLKKTKEQRNQLKTQVSEQEAEIQRMEQEVHDKEAAILKLKSRRVFADTEERRETCREVGVRSRDVNTPAHTVRSRELTGKVDAINQHELTSLQEEIKSLEYRKLELAGMIKEEEQQRRRLSKRLQDLVGTIHVSCRIKPHPENYLKVVSDDKLLFPRAPPTQSNQPRSPDFAKPFDVDQMRCFIFEKVLGPGSGHYEIFKKLGQPLTRCLDGQNLCIMTYGPKQSGKSFTMFGNFASKPGELTDNTKGIAQDAVHLLLSLTRQRIAWAYTIYLRAISVTDEGIMDLLQETHPARWCNIPNGNNEDCTTSLKSFELITSAEFDNVVRMLRCREYSKRGPKLGHLLIQLTIEGEQKTNKQSTVNSTLILADLASWENMQTKDDSVSTSVLGSAVIPVINSSEESPRPLCEPVSCGVNQSLLALSRLFATLRKRKTPSFKDSPLTRLLRPVLVGNSKCFLIITIDSDPNEFTSTLASLQFAQNAMQATTNQWPKMHHRILQHANSAPQWLDK